MKTVAATIGFGILQLLARVLTELPEIAGNRGAACLAFIPELAQTLNVAFARCPYRVSLLRRHGNLDFLDISHWLLHRLFVVEMTTTLAARQIKDPKARARLVRNNQTKLEKP